MPALVSGLRVATVQSIGLATVAALIGAGGLGTFVFQGIGEYALDLVLVGALPTILLAVAADALFPDRARQPAEPSVIEFDAVEKSYAGQRRARSALAEHSEGALCVLVGPSGCGKSTTLKMINALIVARCRNASASTDSRLPRARSKSCAAASATSFNRAVCFRTGACATISPLCRGFCAGTKRASPRASTELADIVAIDRALLDRFPHQLSGGQQQRVGVARALAADPDIILMDEPFGALDPVTRAALQKELARLHRETGKTIVLVTHDMDEALALGTMIAVMQSGEIVQSGTPAEMLAHPRNDFVRGFVGGADAMMKLLDFRRVGEFVARRRALAAASRYKRAPPCVRLWRT